MINNKVVWEKFYKKWRDEKKKAQKLVKKSQDAQIGWKVIHQRKIKGYFHLWEQYLKYIDNNEGASEEEIIQNTEIHWRGTMYLRYLGFIHKNSTSNNQIITDPGKRFYKEPSQREQILQQQVGKWYYCIRNLFRPGDDSYMIYPFFILLKILLVIGDKFPKSKIKYYISFDEFKYFVITTKKYVEWEKSVDLIIAYRESNGVQKEVLDDIFSNTSFDRIIFILELSKYIKFTNDGLFIKKELMENTKELVFNFEELLNNNLIPFYQENPEKYLDMLYSDTNLIDYLKEEKGINDVVKELIKIENKEEVSERDAEIVEEKFKPFIKSTLDETKDRVKRILEQRDKKIKQENLYQKKRQTKFTERESKKYERGIGRILANFYGKCQISDCGFSFPKGENGKKGPYCEAHHLNKLSDDGKDIPENIIILCANHHRMFHYNDPKIILRDDEKLVVELCGEKKVIHFKYKFV